MPRELTTVTKTSKVLVAVVFITLPLLAFFLGSQYQSLITLNKIEDSNKSSSGTIISMDSTDERVKQLTPLCNTGGALRYYGFSLSHPNILEECTCQGSIVKVVVKDALDADWKGCTGNVSKECFELDKTINGFSYEEYLNDNNYSKKLNKTSCPTTESALDEGATAEGISKAVEANNQFAFEMYSELKDEEGNIFYSPLSLSSALAMVYEGAGGKTAKEIESVFHFSPNESERKSAFGALYNQINKENAQYQLSLANALWAQKDYPFLPTYLNNVEKYYIGKATNLDFVNSTEEARQTINRWVEDKTSQKIKDLFPKDSIDPVTKLVLTNAIYFKGIWAKQFDKKQTKEEEFRVNASTRVKVPMMRQTGEEANFNYGETEKLQILEMPYEGEDLSMLILLPKGEDFSSLEKETSLENLTRWRKGLNKERVDVYLPKFKFDRKYTLNNSLIKMGMPTAFSDRADLSKMDGTKNLKIDKVFHQAFVEVNEEGTEAAAATGVVVVPKVSIPSPVKTFRADHPFIFLILDKQNSNILFLGRVVNPTS